MDAAGGRRRRRALAHATAAVPLVEVQAKRQIQSETLGEGLIPWRLGLRGAVIDCSVAAVFLVGVDPLIYVPPPANFSFHWLAAHWFPRMLAGTLVLQFVPYAIWVRKFDRYFRDYLEKRGSEQLPPAEAQSA